MIQKTEQTYYLREGCPGVKILEGKEDITEDNGSTRAQLRSNQPEKEESPGIQDTRYTQSAAKMESIDLLVSSSLSRLLLPRSESAGLASSMKEAHRELHGVHFHV